MEEDISERFEHPLAEDSRLDRTHLRRYREYSQREKLRPGFTRINLPYFLDEESLEYSIEAVKLVAEVGWKLLPRICLTLKLVNGGKGTFRKWLGLVTYNSGEMSYKIPPLVNKGPLPDNYKDCLQKAKNLFAQAGKTKHQLADHTVMFDEASKSLRWFLLPSGTADCLQGNQSQNAPNLPFCPPILREQIGLPVFPNQHKEEIISARDMLDNNLEIERTFETIENKLLVGDRKETIPDKNSENEDYNRGKNVDRSDGKNCADIGNTGKETFKEGMQNCLDNCFHDLDTVDKTSCDTLSESKPVTCVDDTEENISASKHDKNRDGKENEVCNIEKDAQASVKPVELSGNSPSNSKICDSLVCENVNMCRKRPAEADGSGPTCALSVKRTKDEEGNKEIVVDAKDKKHTDRKSKTKKEGTRWFSPPKTIFTPYLKAVEEYEMKQDGDNVMVCLSGGKDSLSLLHAIKQYQFYCKRKNLHFTIGAVTVDPQTPSYDPSPLKVYLASLRVPYFYESQGILEQASNLPYECESICSFCSRMKRGRIYACARREGYNVLALRQHLDDLCESFLMSIFHNGLLRTMKANYTVEEGELRVIRPFVYVRGKYLRLFAETNKLPVTAENCPVCFEAPKERHRIKQLLASQEIMFPRIFPSLMAAIKPIMTINKTQMKLSDFLKQDKNNSDDDFDI